MKANTLISVCLIGLLNIGLISCGGGAGTGASSASGNNTPQYTPSQAAWATFSIKPLASGINTSHDPDGIGWLTPASWQSAQWNGTVYNPETLTRTQLAAAICPTGD
ncbi:MAG: hypothetical protein Q9M17_04830, partial [Mariprofundus sp.]|nr:hypothetical protein [Mariprofundus sp.]